MVSWFQPERLRLCLISTGLAFLLSACTLPLSQRPGTPDPLRDKKTQNETDQTSSLASGERPATLNQDSVAVRAQPSLRNLGRVPAQNQPPTGPSAAAGAESTGLTPVEGGNWPDGGLHASLGGAPYQPETLVIGGTPAEDVTKQPDSLDPDGAAFSRDPAMTTFQPVKVGLLLPLSGPAATAGRALANAAELALFNFSDGGLALMPYDTQGNEGDAVRAMQNAVNDRVRLVIGPLYAASTRQVTPIANAHNIPILSFSNNPSILQPNVYGLGFQLKQQVQRIITYAIQRGHNQFATLIPESAFGGLVAAGMLHTVEKTKAKIGHIELYPPNIKNMSSTIQNFAKRKNRRGRFDGQRSQIRQIIPDDRSVISQQLDQIARGNHRFDALLLPVGGTQAKIMGPLLAYYDVEPEKVRFLGLNRWDDPTLGSEPTLNGAWFVSLDPVRKTYFQDAYQKAFDEMPPTIAILAYDAVAVVAALVRRHGRNGLMKRFLEQPTGFQGAAGVFRLHSNGVVERQFAIMEVKRNGPVEIDAAAQAF